VNVRVEAIPIASGHRLAQCGPRGRCCRSMLKGMLVGTVPNNVLKRTGQQRRFACCCPAA
jgi:hypothetical protein